ncbi:MAG: FtsX-like permease family protein [Gammaproteobacteria bacterium]|jgi:putative ABC transport system permease protein|nr:FtsX-like permease family protein [Gammaproteobacteria bacterium]
MRPQVPAFAWRAFMRDLRAGELSVLLTAIVLAVTAMTAVGFFTDRVGASMKEQASQVLAADLVLRSAAPLPADFQVEARELGLETAETLAFPTVVVVGEQTALAAVDAVSDAYPLRGQLTIADTMFGEGRSAEGVPARGEAWAEPGLLGRLNVDVGATLTLGNLALRITRVLQYKPDQNIGFVNLAPGLMVNLADVPAMGVVKPGSRVTWHQMYAGSDAQIGRFRESIEPRLRPDTSIRGREDAGEQINAAIDRAQRFLTLASLVTVILAAVAAAMAARRYALRHLDNIALLKTLGASQRFVLAVTMGELLLIIAATSLLGVLLGYGAQYGLAVIAAELVGFVLPPASGQPFLLGVLTAATVVVGFALPHLLRLGSTPPLRVLRKDLPAPQLGALATWGTALAAIAALVFVIVRDALLVGLIAGGLVAMALLAGGIGWLLVRSLGRFRGAAGIAWRYGLANIARRGPESIVQIVAFGLSLMVLLLLGVVRNDILSTWEETLPDTAPNHFMINIEPEQLPGLRAFFQAEVDRDVTALPLIRGRLSAINGQPASAFRAAGAQGAAFLQREANLTWTAALPASNKLTDGQWWGSDYAGPPQVSLDAKLAASLGIGVGDNLRFNVAGEDIEAAVTSLRNVEWDSFQPNFFVVLSPGLAADLPQTYLASVYVPRDRVRILSQLVRQFPGVTVIDLEVLLAQVRSVIDRAALAVQYVFVFTLLAGLVVLLAAIQITRDERRFESAILHTLGAARRKILQGVAAEFLTLGSLSGVLAAFGATALGWALAHYAFKLDYGVSPLLWPLGLLAGALIVGVAGTLATRRAVSEPPVAVLRDRA